ncbi:hypothetical protein [Thermococcus peptonophilus]|uniref:hypothetical protein n=1 Tax=Thermococcus peptonophilus TaxID=53952 RepID=UPI0006D1AF8D
MTSNKVHIQVRKIPTSFIVTGETSAVINTTLTLKAKLVDYYGNALANRTVLVDGVPIMTDENGTLSRDYFSPIPAVITVPPLEFEGDKTHDGTATNVTLVFRKIAVSISLAGPDSITAGKTGKFHGTMTPGSTRRSSST